MDDRHRRLAVTRVPRQPDPLVLVVAGSDSSGGAGFSRDIESVAALGLRSSVAVTAVTVQTNRKVLRVEPMPPVLVADQMRAAFETNPIGAIKVGMLGTQAIVEAVATVLREHPELPVILDPVLNSSSGGSLLDAAAVMRLIHTLVPLCRLVTPNWIELAILAGDDPARDEDEALRQGEVLLTAGADGVLIKGGHAPGVNSTDILLRHEHAPVRFDAPRLDYEMRGTGCMLSSAVAACLAKGHGLEDSVGVAKAQVLQAFLIEGK